MIQRWLRTGVSVLFLLGTSLRGGEDRPTNPFLDLTFQQALSRAAKEKRVVFIDFYTTWCAPCKKLDSTTWKDEKVIALLGKATIPLRIDAEKEVDLGRKFGIDAYPTLLLLRPDGTILDRMVGYKDPEHFLVSLKSSLAGKDSLARARDSVSEASTSDLKSQVDARYKLAKALAEQGKDAEALKEFLWLYDEGMKQVKEFIGVRSSFLLSEIARLAKKYPPAKEALLQRRDEAKNRFLADPEDAGSAADLPYLNRSLQEDGATLEVYDQLPKGSPGRKTMGQFVLRELLVQRRYAEVVEIRPLKEFLVLNARLEANTNPVFRGVYLDNCAREIEALAGAGLEADAVSLLKKALAMDNTQGTRKLMEDHLKRAGHPELML